MGIDSVNQPQPRRAVFLDRDGVLIRECSEDEQPRAARNLEEVEILPGVMQALSHLRAKGLLLVMVTNQPEISRGTLERCMADHVNCTLQDSLGLDEIMMCPHDDVDHCTCRKPKPGLLIEVSERLHVDLRQSVMVGDRWSDVEAGHAAGCKTVLIVHGCSEQPVPVANLYTHSLLDAVPWIVKATGDEYGNLYQFFENQALCRWR